MKRKKKLRKFPGIIYIISQIYHMLIMSEQTKSLFNENTLFFKNETLNKTKFKGNKYFYFCDFNDF